MSYSVLRAFSHQIPFQEYNGRQMLTGLQLVQEPWLADFIAKYPNHFAHGPINMDCMFYYPDGDAPQQMKEAI